MPSGEVYAARRPARQLEPAATSYLKTSDTGWLPTERQAAILHHMDEMKPSASDILASRGIAVDEAALAELCRRYQVRELSVFGSVLRDDFHAASDIDVLVEFEPGAPIGLIEYSRLQREMATLLGRVVDLVSKPGLKPMIRDNVLSEARLLYAA